MEKKKKSNEDKYLNDPQQIKIRKMLKLEWVTKRKLDEFSAMKYLLREIYEKNKKSGIEKIGWEAPDLIPFNPTGFAYKASTSGSFYNLKLIRANETKYEYDFVEAYTTIMRNYLLPSNTYLKAVKIDTEKALKRIREYYPEKRPYAELQTFTFYKIEIDMRAKDSTFADPNSQSMLSDYGEMFNDEITVSEIELKLLFDFYDVKNFKVLDNHTFKCKKGMLDEYFNRIEPLQHDPDTLKLYKRMRNKVYGTIGQKRFVEGEASFFNQPFYNRAFSAMVAGVFRDRMVRYEQKYVHSPYGLIDIRTDAFFFRKEVPEFEKFVELGIMKKKVHTITMEEENIALDRISVGDI